MGTCTAVATGRHEHGSQAERECPVHGVLANSPLAAAVASKPPLPTSSGNPVSVDLDGTECSMDEVMEMAHQSPTKDLRVSNGTIMVNMSDRIELPASLTFRDCVIDLNRDGLELFSDQEEKIVTLERTEIKGGGVITLPPQSHLYDVDSDASIYAPSAIMRSVKGRTVIAVTPPKYGDEFPASAELEDVSCERGTVEMRSCDDALGISADVVSIESVDVDEPERYEPGMLTLSSPTTIYLEHCRGSRITKREDHYYWDDKRTDTEAEMVIQHDEGCEPVIISRSAAESMGLFFKDTSKRGRDSRIRDIFTDRGDGYGYIDVQNSDAVEAMDNLGGIVRDQEAGLIIEVDRSVIPAALAMFHNPED